MKNWLLIILIVVVKDGSLVKLYSLIKVGVCGEQTKTIHSRTKNLGSWERSDQKVEESV
jgi:hypothetical protein